MTQMMRRSGSNPLQDNSKHTELAKNVNKAGCKMRKPSVKGSSSPAPASWECLSGWAKQGNQISFILNPSSLTHQWKLSCWAVLFAAQLPGNSTSLEDKQNGRRRVDRLAPVATSKPPLFIQHKACGGCGTPEMGRLFLGVSGFSRMSSAVWPDRVVASASVWPLHLEKRPTQLNKGYQIQNSFLLGWILPISPAETPNGKKYYILSCLRKNNTHITTDCSLLREGPLLCETSKHGLLIMGTAIPAYMLAL